MRMIIQLLFTITIAGSSIVACLLVLRLILPNMITNNWYYRIGKMAIAFYLLPITLLFQWISSLLTLNATTPILISEKWHSSTHYVSLLKSVPINISVDVAFLVISIWIIGVIVFAGWQVYCYQKLLKKIQHSYIPVSKNSEAAKQLIFMKEVLGINRNVRLAYSTIVRSPVLIGLWKPTIYLPTGNNADVDMCMVIHHELIHLKRNDLWTKALVLGANALHWFNPLVYVLRKKIHIWSEFSCDEEVVREMSHDERKRYGETILNVIIGSEGLPAQFCSSLSGNGKKLKRRLSMMMNVKKIKKRTMIISVITIIIFGVIGTSTAVWASTKTPEVTPKIVAPDIDYSEKQEKNVADEKVNKNATEMEMIPAREATDEQIQKYHQQLGDDVSDSEFWDEVEDDPLETSAVESQYADAVEAEEVIFVE